MTYHYTIQYGPEWVAFGRFAVESFFVISGFVVSRAAARTTAGEFLVARVLRLWPALIVCSLLTVAIAWRQDIPWLALLRALTFVPMLLWAHENQVDSAYWSLVIELRFYLGLGVLLLLRGRLPNLDLISALWLVASAIAVVVPPLRVVTLTPYSAFFIFGLLFSSRRNGSRWAVWLMAPALLLAGWQAFIDFERVDLMKYAHRSPLWVGYCAAFVAIAIPAIAIRVRPPRWLAQASVKVLAPLSYPLYLVHGRAGAVLLLAITPALGWQAAALVGMAVAILVALGISTWIEPWLSGVLRRAVGLLRRAEAPAHVSCAPKA